MHTTNPLSHMRLFWLSGVAAMACAAPVQAQQAQPPSSAEIVVTAQKRVERLQDVPQSISVASQADLERAQVNTVSDLARIAPSLEIQQAPGQSVGGGGQIRGIGTQSFQNGAVGSVGVVVDQVSQGNVNISDLFDIARVEVLKGPQGTLFGLTTSAGVINITTNKPDFTRFSARIRSELSAAGTAGSEYGQQVVQGLVNVPVAANAALRVSGNMNLRQGVGYNTLTGKYDAHDTWGLRGRFLWQPTDRLTVNIIGDYSQTRDRGSDFFTIYKANSDLASTLAQCGIVAGAGNRSYCSNTDVRNLTKTYGGSIQIDYDAGAVQLTSVSAYREQKTGPGMTDIFRLDPYGLRILSGPANGRQSLFTQELRAASPSGAKLEYTIGLFGSSQRQYTQAANFDIYANTPFGLFPVVAQSGTDIWEHDDSLAVFGQATWHVGDHLRLIGGGRYTSEKLDVPYYSRDTLSGGHVSTTVGNVSWKGGAQYEFNRRLMTYVTISRGYKGSQVALGDLTVAGNVPKVIRPEIPTNYEAGLKATMMGGRLALDLSAFWMDLKDYQGQLCTPNSAGGLTCNPQNISNVASRGIEFNLSGRATRELTFNAGLIWNPVTYPAGFLGQDGSDLSGRQLQAAPLWKGTLSAEYARSITQRVDGFLSGDVVYKSSLRVAASTDPNLTWGPHATLGGRIGIRSADGRWSAAIFGRNLTGNREPVLRYANFPDGSTGSYGQILTPAAFRQVGLQVDAKF